MKRLLRAAIALASAGMVVPAGGTAMSGTAGPWQAAAQADGFAGVTALGRTGTTGVADKTILGIGSTAEITGGGLQLGTTTRPGTNVIVRNLRFSAASDDSISVTNGAHHVWIDHNEFLPAHDGSLERVPFPCHSVGGYAESDPGRLVQRANVFTGSGTCEAGGTVTEPSTFYSYHLDSASSVPAAVSAGAGVGRIP